MAKRPRPRATREAAGATSTERAIRQRRRAGPHREEGILDRYRTVLIAAVAVAGLLLIGFMFFQGATRAAYDCHDRLTPGPTEAQPTPHPTPRPSPSPGASPTGSPGASPSPAGSATPEASPTAEASPTPDASPTAAPSPVPDPTARLGFPTTDLGRLHVPTGQPITYGYCPPASGPHYNQAGVAPLPPSVYPPAQERAPGYWVHNLEHGYIIVLYRCPSGQLGEGDCISRAEMDQLEAFFSQAPAPPFSSCPNKTMIARFDSMTSRFAMLAWDRALLVDEFDLADALTFADQWMEYDQVVLPERLAC